MDLKNSIRKEFSLTMENTLSDEFIRNNTNILWIKEKINFMEFLPSYMLWCVENRDIDGSLVCDHTISVLAEFGRAKDTPNNYLNFKYRCNDRQKAVVNCFLNWCLLNLIFCNKEQIKRAIKNWGQTIQ